MASKIIIFSKLLLGRRYLFKNSRAPNKSAGNSSGPKDQGHKNQKSNNKAHWSDPARTQIFRFLRQKAYVSLCAKKTMIIENPRYRPQTPRSSGQGPRSMCTVPEAQGPGPVAQANLYRNLLRNAQIQQKKVLQPKHVPT